MQSINPATGEVVKSYTTFSRQEVEKAIIHAQHTFLSWRNTNFSERARLMRQVAIVLRDHKKTYAALMTEEMGKTLREGESEIEKCAFVCDYYAEHAANYLADEAISTDASKSFITYQPLGVVLAVMPWNFPFWQVLRFAAPALMAGNVALLKHASNVPGCSLALEEVFIKAGFPKGCFTSLLVKSDQVAAIIEHPSVKAVTLTGSTKAGQAVAAKAGAMLKKTVLELGGSDPYIILEDADLSLAVKTCVKSRLINAGQSCIAAKRFIVVEKIYQTFVEQFVSEMKQVKMGDPTDPANAIGPQATVELRDQLHYQVEQSIAKGAQCLWGGVIPKDKGAYYPPTVLVNVVPGMPAYEEELFGPVAAIIKAKNEADAIRVANDSVFGLSGGIFSSNVSRAEAIAVKQMELGGCFINTFSRSDPRLPFGGIKESGYGRELSSFGIREFTNIKTIYII